MDTILGRILIFINEIETDFALKKLSNMSHHFQVDGRYKLEIKMPSHCIENEKCIKCIIIPNQSIALEECVESGERLALLSFYYKNIKLSIGTEGDLPNFKYKYLKNGIQIDTKSMISDIVFYVAWLTMNESEKEDIYTWFAADPAFDN